jgi:hypothetical protein
MHLGFAVGNQSVGLGKRGMISLALLAACLTAAPPVARSQTLSIGSLSGWDGVQSVTGPSYDGDTNLSSIMAVGETFHFTSGNAKVTSITFPLFANVLGSFDFQVGVAAWNGNRPTGPTLYLSDELFCPSNSWQNYVVTPDNLVLNQGQQYVLLFSGIKYLDGQPHVAAMGYVPGNPYPDGQYFFLGMGGSNVGINDLFAQDWTGVALDMAFQMDYQTVPEPANNALLALGLWIFILYRRIPPARIVVSVKGTRN